MSQPILINVAIEGFDATLPWSRAIDARHLLTIAACPDNIIQAAMLIDEFRNQLAIDKQQAFDQLDIFEMTEVVTQWIDKTNEISNKQLKLAKAAQVIAAADQTSNDEPTNQRRWWQRRP